MMSIPLQLDAHTVHFIPTMRIMVLQSLSVRCGAGFTRRKGNVPSDILFLHFSGDTGVKKKHHMELAR